jgi:hypothetical protein
LLALAVTAVVAATGWWMYLSSPHGRNQGVVQQPAPQDDWSDESLRLTAADIDHGLNLYRNVSEVVEGRAGWVAVGAETTELGVATSPVAVRGSLVLLRLSMTRDGKVASNTDLAMLPGQTVELSVPLENRQILRYKIKTNGTTARRVSVWAEVHDAARQDQTVAALATNLSPKHGQVIRAGKLQTSEGGYELAMAFAEQEMTGNTP